MGSVWEGRGNVVYGREKYMLYYERMNKREYERKLLEPMHESMVESFSFLFEILGGSLEGVCGGILTAL